MKRFYTAIASALGLATASDAQTQTAPVLMDPKTILFSLATINDALPAVGPAALKTGDLKIHEDDWRQFEVISRTLEPQIKEELRDIKRIYDEKSKLVGKFRAFTEVHVRKRITAPLPTLIVWKDLLAAAGVEEGAVSGVGFLDAAGQIPDGFSFRVGDVTLFGRRKGEIIEVLCLDSPKPPRLGEAQAMRLAAFLDKSGAVLVDWPSMKTVLDKEAMLQYLRNDNKGRD